MKSIIALSILLLFASVGYANDGKIMGPVLALGTSLYDDDNNAGTPDIEVGQVLLDETDAHWDADMDGDSSTFGDDCSVSLIFASDMINLSTEGGKAMYSALLSAQNAGSARLAVIEYEEDANGNCVVKSALTLPSSLF